MNQNITTAKEYIKNNLILIGLIITLVVAVILRFKGLTFQSHWLDELFSATFSNPSNSFSHMIDVTISDVHPPLYQSILWVWYHIFGFNEFAGRSLSAIIGSFGVLAIYLLGKELFNKEVGLYAAIVASMNYFLIFYSQETRSYSLLFLLSSISYIYFIKVLTNYSKKNFLLYLFFTIALVYTHYFGLFLVATQVFVFMFYFIKEKDKRKLFTTLAVITAAVITISILPLLINILRLEGKESYWMAMPSEWFALDYMRSYVKSQYLEAIYLLLISFSFIYLFKRVNYNRFKSMIIVLLIWIIVGYLLPYIRSITALPLLTSRNTIMIIPALILLISYGIYLLKDTRLKVATIGIIVLFSFYQLNHPDYYNTIKKQQWREVLIEVSSSKETIPSYDFIGLYPAYKSMLDLDMNIENKSILKEKLENNTLEQCFFAIDAHGDHIAKSIELQDKNITKVLEIKKYAARGVLYAYKRNPQTCLNLYYGVLLTVDFKECNLSRPYKGNPLGMWWSGSVTTPTYALNQHNYSLVVNAKGTKAFDEYAKLKLQVFQTDQNSNELLAEKTIETTSKYTDYTLNFELQQDGNISFVVSFINNKGRSEPKEDRNAYLKFIGVKE